MPDDVRGYSPLLGISQRQPPSNVQAEQALLGAILRNNKALDRVADFLDPEHFADPVNGRIYAECRKLIGSGRLADAVTLKSIFENAGVLDEVGGTEYLGQLLTAMVGIINAGEYGRVVHDAWIRREAIGVGEELVNAGFGQDPSASGHQVIDEAVASLLSLGEASETRAGATLGAAAARAVQGAEAAFRGDAGHVRLDTGLPSMDGLWQGLWPGQLYYLMARSRTGKTPAMLQIVRHVAGALAAAGSGSVHIFSLEMSAEDLATVNLASTSRWTADQIKAGRIGDASAWLELGAARDALATLPVHIDDAPEMDLSALVVRARALRRQRDTRLICIDFRELIRRPREHAKMGLPEWIPFLGYQLKALAKACGVPVLALAQINKGGPNAGQRPTLDDLPYDGGQAADGVFALHRPELYMGDTPPRAAGRVPAEKQAAADAAWHAEREAVAGVAEFVALKRRFGPPGMCRLRFDGPRMLLRESTVDAYPSDLLTAPLAESEDDYG